MVFEDTNSIEPSNYKRKVLILDGNSEIGAHLGSDLGYLICLGLFFLDLERSHI